MYDLLRLIRLRRRRNRRLTHALDGLFVAAVTLTAAWFALRVGQGELRLVMLSAMALGALVYALRSARCCCRCGIFGCLRRRPRRGCCSRRCAGRPGAQKKPCPPRKKPFFFGKSAL